MGLSRLSLICLYSIDFDASSPDGFPNCNRMSTHLLNISIWLSHKYHKCNMFKTELRVLHTHKRNREQKWKQGIHNCFFLNTFCLFFFFLVKNIYCKKPRKHLMPSVTWPQSSQSAHLADSIVWRVLTSVCDPYSHTFTMILILSPSSITWMRFVGNKALICLPVSNPDHSNLSSSCSHMIILSYKQKTLSLQALPWFHIIYKMKFTCPAGGTLSF